MGIVALLGQLDKRVKSNLAMLRASMSSRGWREGAIFCAAEVKLSKVIQTQSKAIPALPFGNWIWYGNSSYC